MFAAWTQDPLKEREHSDRLRFIIQHSQTELDLCRRGIGVLVEDDTADRCSEVSDSVCEAVREKGAGLGHIPITKEEK